ncbi:MAG TPA: type IX secretion system membrane protein PorP/SprF [Paludibacteraceae bacterium]|jgi:type IX secretion system PorP/SprF family membrane protein|nr:type IX secretion system membrane protein PorP/SprF [Paludibacteraceae bacterium]HPL94785.1 type IX secretion system membrane protein PorP/SprF [Paludibacteraceae bacterium]
MKKILFIFFACIAGYVVAFAQQAPMYSQYMFNMLNVNPAYAGNRAVQNVTLLHRHQWVGFEGNPRTSSLSWDMRAEDSNNGFGAQIYNDQLGVENTTGLQGFYSYKIPLKNASFALGLSAGLLNFSAAYTEVTTIDPNDPAFAENANTFLPTVGVGLLYASEKWYLGLSVPALLRTKDFLAEAEALVNKFGATNHYFITGGYVVEVNPNLALKPSLLFKAVSGAPLQTDININAWWNQKWGAGASFRTGDAVVAMLEYQITNTIRLGYAFDYSISQLNAFNQGTHEIMLRYEFDTSKAIRVLSPRYY